MTREAIECDRQTELWLSIHIYCWTDAIVTLSPTSNNSTDKILGNHQAANEIHVNEHEHLSTCPCISHSHNSMHKWNIQHSHLYSSAICGLASTLNHSALPQFFLCLDERKNAEENPYRSLCLDSEYNLKQLHFSRQYFRMSTMTTATAKWSDWEPLLHSVAVFAVIEINRIYRTQVSLSYAVEWGFTHFDFAISFSVRFAVAINIWYFSACKIIHWRTANTANGFIDANVTC